MTCKTTVTTFSLNYPPPSSISGSVPARDEIPVIFVRIFFRRTHISSVLPFGIPCFHKYQYTSCTCKFNMADANRK